jgi:hypothetical protein
MSILAKELATIDQLGAHIHKRHTQGGKSWIIYVSDIFTIHSIKFNSKLFFEILFMDSIDMYNVYNNPPQKNQFPLTNNM